MPELSSLPLHDRPHAILPPKRIIWSATHLGPLVVPHMRRVIDAADDAGADGVEIGGHVTDLHRFVCFDRFAPAAPLVDADRVARESADLAQVASHAKSRGLRLSIWHHEISGPRGLLEAVPDLRAGDGLVNLDSPVLYDYIRAKVDEFFRRFPQFDDLVLTLTESQIPVAHRPYCDIPVAERIRRVIQAVADATEPLGRTLVIRPFSAIRSDELAVREAVGQLKAQRVELMYKTEPYDWHPYLEDEPLIGSVPQYPCRAETDGGAEYYGQAIIPCCYARHIGRRIAAALGRGATTVTLRVDRGAHHPSLGTPVNEANIVPVTRWLRDPSTPLDGHVQQWVATRHGCSDPALTEIFHESFEVIRRCMYIGEQAMSHSLFPSFEHAKHVQLFALFEPDVSLGHMKDNWGMRADQRTPTHQELLEAKRQAAELARTLRTRYARVEPAVTRRDGGPFDESLPDLLDRLVVLADACLALCELIAAHLAQMWSLPAAPGPGYAEARDRALALADQIDRRWPPPFYPRANAPSRQMQLSDALRDHVRGLEHERALEIPLRKSLAAKPGRVDEVLCGFASEGHRPRKRLHSGATLRIADRCARATGLGEHQGFGYTLAQTPGCAHQLTVEFAGCGKPMQGALRVGDLTLTVTLPASDGLVSLTWDLPSAQEPNVDIYVWSTGRVPLRTTLIRMARMDAPENFA